jgi:hypothetical protein
VSNADVVLSALRSFAPADGRVAAPLSAIAALTDLHEGAVRRAMAQLCHERRIEPVGKEGRNTLFQITLDPAGQRRRRDATPKEESSSSTNDRSTARDPTRPLPGRTTAEPELTAEEKDELRRIGLTALYGILDRFGTEEDELGEPDQPGGECGECGQEARRRYSLGLFLLCRDCRERRARAAAQGGTGHADRAAPVEQEPELVPIVPAQLDTELYGQLARNGNGNGRSPLWDEPEF